MASPTNSSQNGGIIGVSNAASNLYVDKMTLFTGSGCFTKASANPEAPGKATVVVAAGGGGGGWDGGGGGGAGGMIIKQCHVLPASAVPVTIGAGGAGATGNNDRGDTGANSVFGSACAPITAAGGGGGGSENCAPARCGIAGGSGGGGIARCGPRAGAAGNSPAVPAPLGGPQGNPGGRAVCAGGSGGGHGSAGEDIPAPYNPSCTGGDGGAGTDVTPFFNAPSSFTFPCSACAPRGVLGGVGIYAGGGGGGSGNDNRTGGTGGGGNPAPGPLSPYRPAKVNTAGGGAGASNSPYVGGAGGSGLVIVGEKCQQPCGTAAPGVWSMQSVYSNVRAGTWTN